MVVQAVAMELVPLLKEENSLSLFLTPTGAISVSKPSQGVVWTPAAKGVGPNLHCSTSSESAQSAEASMPYLLRAAQTRLTYSSPGQIFSFPECSRTKLSAPPYMCIVEDICRLNR